MKINSSSPDYGLAIWDLFDATIAADSGADETALTNTLCVNSDLPRSQCAYWADNYATQNLRGT